MFLVFDSPKEHPFINDLERDYLIRETRKEVSAKEKGGKLVFSLFKLIFINQCFISFDLINTYYNGHYLI